MKRLILSGATANALVLSSQAFAQSAQVEINPEQRTRIKDYVVKEKVAPVTGARRRQAPRGCRAPFCSV